MLEVLFVSLLPITATYAKQEELKAWVEMVIAGLLRPIPSRLRCVEYTWNMSALVRESHVDLFEGN